MFDKKLFVYNEEKHEGYYPNENGELVLIPSISQLVNIAFPLASNIPEENLKKASVRGTTIHEMVEELNKCENYEEMRNLAYGTENEDLINYTRLLQTFGLKAISCEETVYLVDENDELITYGHYDMVLRSVEDTEFLPKNCDVMFDLKTVNEFEDEKVKLQTEMYRVAYQQAHNELLILSTGGIHLRDGKAKIHFFTENIRNDEEIVDIAKKLRDIYESGRR